MNKTIGIFAHVDAGKTTFSEQLLYYTKSIREMGRVDYQNSHLDTNEIEQQRGITIYADQATFALNGHTYTMIDTPGHVDFSAEMERSILALDAAILLLDGTDGVQGHTETIWALLEKHKVPTILFSNKMDLQGADESWILQQLQSRLSQNVCPFSTRSEAIELFASLDEERLERFFDDATTEDEWLNDLSEAFMNRQLYPVFYGAALKGEGIQHFLDQLDVLLNPLFDEKAPLNASIYKIRHIEQNQRIAFVKIHAGEIKIRQQIELDDEIFKITQIRQYNGLKFTEQQSAKAGEVVAIVGLKNARVGMNLNNAYDYAAQMIPTMRAKVNSKSSRHPKEILENFRLLEAEDPALSLDWQEEMQEMTVNIMGKIQLEVLAQVVYDRFGEEVEFENPTIIYKETISDQVIGFGHFDPLHHYAEVHLKIMPNELGKGIKVNKTCHPNVLTPSLQNLIEQYLIEGGHHGILTGSEITDLSIDIINGSAHQKHTAGGDFREATLRALRQGLEQAENILLEPVYRFKMKAGIDLLGKMMTDLQQMQATIDVPEAEAEFAILSGIVPVSTMLDYPAKFAAYTSGRGSLQLVVSGYMPCHNSKEVVEQRGYRKAADPKYSSNSVFCVKGKKVTVPWDEAIYSMDLNTEY